MHMQREIDRAAADAYLNLPAFPVHADLQLS
jgi:hypothetical protein